MTTQKPGQAFMAREWAAFRERAIPDVTEPVQIVETRRAFYAGAAAMMCAVHRVGQDDVTEQEGCDVFSGIQDELDAFLTDVQAGRA